MKKIITLFVALIMFVPSVSSAYQVLETKTVKITNNAYLYSITYQLGFEKYAVSAPIGAIRSLNSSSTSPYVKFMIQKDNVESQVGVANAFVFSDADIENAEYIVPRGEARRFTLLALITIPDEEMFTGSSLQVTSLPFTLKTADEVSENGLSKGELSYYKTPIIN